MRRILAIWYVLFALVIVGCLNQKSQRSSSLLARLPLTGPVGEDVIQIDLAIVECPFGDRYLNVGLWELADEQVIKPLARKTILDHNGFRVCTIGGLAPGKLLELLTSRRTCPSPRRIRLRAGTPMPVLFGDVLPTCSFETWHDKDQVEKVECQQAQCFLQVVPTLTSEGDVTLEFTPHIKHGKLTLGPRPRQEPSGLLRWEWGENQPEEVYTALRWQLTVPPNEYVVVGTLLDKVDRLGYRFFVSREGERPVQRLLVLRTTRVVGEKGSPTQKSPSQGKADWPPAPSGF